MSKFSTKIHQYTIILEPCEEGGFTVSVPALPGCITEGDSFQEAIDRAKDAIQGYVMSLLKHNEPIPDEWAPLITTAVNIKLPDRLRVRELAKL
ncbi:MAG: type II toxin-antitoxin system HicB family antitoxin [Candidatus Jacksonbacteria bacterium]